MTRTMSSQAGILLHPAIRRFFTTDLSILAMLLASTPVIAGAGLVGFILSILLNQDVKVLALIYLMLYDILLHIGSQKRMYW